MSELISRSKLLKRFLVNKDGHRIPERNCDNFEVTVSIKDIKRIIKEQPTAYDIDKVVEELEELLQDLNVIEIISHIDFDSTIQNSLDKFLKSFSNKAIEIVKQGGVSDDVCEWRLCDEEADVYDTSCRNLHIFFDGTPEKNKYKFCPYCGKKILCKE